METISAGRVARSRRRDVEAALAALELPRGGGRRTRRATRLAQALHSLGPVFAGFGLYLASRVDLLSRPDCAALDAIPAEAAPMPPGAVTALIRRELGGPPAARFHAFDERPVWTGLFTQRHEAWLVPGVRVTVTIVRDDLDAALERDLPLLLLLQPRLGVSRDALVAAVTDFSTTMERRLDLRQQAAALALVGQDTHAVPSFRVPYCYHDVTSRRVLTRDAVEGVPLDDVLAAGAADGAGVRPWPSPAALAQRLTSAWLTQVSNGRALPFEFAGDDILVGLDHVTLVGGTFELQTPESQAHFRNYLEATAVDDVDAACAWVAARSARLPGGLDEEALTRRFRQAVPFRDVESDGEEHLADQLLVHWRILHRSGWQVTRHQLRLYRSLVRLTALTNRLEHRDDALLTALRDEQIRRRLVGTRDLLQAGTLDKLLTNMMNLPRRVDEALSLAAEGGMRLKLQLPEDDAQRRTRNRAVTHVAGLVALLASAFLVRLLVPGLGAGVEQVGAVLLLILGGWLLVAAARL